MGLILDTSLFVADEREQFNLASWLRSRPPEPVAVSAITLSELWFGVEVETEAARTKQRRRWMEKTFRRLEIVPLDAALARVHARLWVQLLKAGQMIGPHDLIVAATAKHRRRAVATFNSDEFRHIPGLEVVVSIAHCRGRHLVVKGVDSRFWLRHGVRPPCSCPFAVSSTGLNAQRSPFSSSNTWSMPLRDRLFVM